MSQSPAEQQGAGDAFCRDRIESSECLCGVGFGDYQMRSVEMGLSNVLGRGC